MSHVSIQVIVHKHVQRYMYVFLYKYIIICGCASDMLRRTLQKWHLSGNSSSERNDVKIRLRCYIWKFKYNFNLQRDLGSNIKNLTKCPY